MAADEGRQARQEPDRARQTIPAAIVASWGRTEAQEAAAASWERAQEGYQSGRTVALILANARRAR